MVSIRKRSQLRGNTDRFKAALQAYESMESPHGYYHKGKSKASAQDKKRKLHRRKLVDNKEPFLRGVYFKNLKWQAAIKVGKKQVHLGTVSTQEEAAHLYDRAAYMCGREPNFALPDEEKKELQAFNWDEFLAVTRQANAHKKMQNKLDAQVRRRQQAEEPVEAEAEAEADAEEADAEAEAEAAAVET